MSIDEYKVGDIVKFKIFRRISDGKIIVDGQGAVDRNLSFELGLIIEGQGLGRGCLGYHVLTIPKGEHCDILSTWVYEVVSKGHK